MKVQNFFYLSFFIFFISWILSNFLLNDQYTEEDPRNKKSIESGLIKGI